METRRKTLGRRIKLARLASGYRSQRAFAEAIGVHENSVARAELGDERIGDAVFTAVEMGLGWPTGNATRYLETGDESLLDEAPTPEPEPPEPSPADQREQLAAELDTLIEHMERLREKIAALPDENDTQSSKPDSNGGNARKAG